MEFLDGTKKVQLATKKVSYWAKKVWLGFRGFRTVFLLLTTPYVMFEIKKTPQILIEFLDGMKKVQLVVKKSFLVAASPLQSVCCNIYLKVLTA